VPKVNVLFNAPGSTVGPVVDLLNSRGSGQLVITQPNDAGGYDVQVELDQAPTISGPWVPLPTGGNILLTATPGAVLIRGYARSARFLQATVTGPFADPYALSILAIEPSASLTFTHT
jgi:hypothetical protein